MPQDDKKLARKSKVSTSPYYLEASKEFLKSLKNSPKRNEALISKVSAAIEQTAQEAKQKIGRDIPLASTPEFKKRIQ